MNDKNKSLNDGDQSSTAENKAIKKAVAGVLESGPGAEHVLVIRNDNPVIVYERQKVGIVGILSTPMLYLEKRHDLINLRASHLIVNREKMTLSLTANEEDHFKHALKGSLEIHPDFAAFGINGGVSWDAFSLGDFVRMNRTFFDSIDFAVKMVTQLKTFKAKVATEREKIQKQNGDFRTVFEQVVTHNLPEKFNLTIPIFKGYPAEKIEVEVHVNPADLSMLLISPEGKDKLTLLKDRAIDEQLAKIREIAPELLITEE